MPIISPQRLAHALAAACVALSVAACSQDITFDEEARPALEAYNASGEADAGDGADVGSDDTGSDDASADAEVDRIARLDHTAWTGTVGRFAMEGCFDYTGVEASPEARALIDTYADQLARVDLAAERSPEARVALWINAYNALTAQGLLNARIADPEARVDVSDFAFFKERRYNVGGINVSLDLIEHAILRRDAQHASLVNLTDDATARERVVEEAARMPDFDPRIHFAINCASVSCPDLRSEAYTGPQLEAQLADQAQRFLDNPDKGAGPDGISRLFIWFLIDFQAVAPVEEFIATYRTDGTEGVDLDQYLEYDWAPNACR